MDPIPTSNYFSSYHMDETEESAYSGKAVE
jgi:hypothetical protein